MPGPTSQRNGKTATVPVSLVVLTYNRPDRVKYFLNAISTLHYQPLEVMIVDNHSDPPVAPLLADNPELELITTARNLGAVGRNAGMRAATGDIVITLDDDVTGLNDSAIEYIVEQFKDATLGALCFKVVDSTDGSITNWCHHCKPELFANQEFLTNEITEGAAAFQRAALAKCGYYPDTFFISHEGPDLAWRLMNSGYAVKYTPYVVVQHEHSPIARVSWRRYYYDTRNLVWLALRNYPILYGVKRTTIGIAAMFIYALRDGYVRYWARGLFDGINGAAEALRTRTPPTKETRRLVRLIEKNRPSFFYLARRRLFSKRVRI